MGCGKRQGLELCIRQLKQVEWEIRSLLFLRRIYVETHELVMAGPVANRRSDFFTFLGVCYATAVSSGLRRLASRKPGDVSLAQFLEALKKDNKLVCKEEYGRLWTESNPNLPFLEPVPCPRFEEFPGCLDGHLSKGQIAADLHELRERTKEVEGYATTYIAHARSDKTRKEPPSWAEMNATVDFVAALTDRYRAILLAEVEPLSPLLSENWKDIFQVPWMSPD